MCNFHEAVALRAAADPETGYVDPGHKTIIRVALSRYWAQRYVEGAENVDGYNFYPLATQGQQSAFEKSGLKRLPADVEQDELDGIEFLRNRLDELGKDFDLSPQGLGLPIATARPAFIDMAIDHFYKGDPKGQFDLVETVPRQDLVPLHRIVSALHADPQTQKVLEWLVKGKICSLYTEAPQRANQHIIAAYETLPQRVKDIGGRIAQYGGNIALGGFSGLIGHGIHYASVLGAGLAAGTASSFNLALSGVFMLASYGGWHQAFGGQYQKLRQQASAFAVQAGLAAVVVVGAQYVLPHDHMHGGRAEWFASLPEVLRQDYIETNTAQYNRLSEDLQRKLDEAALAQGITPVIYLITCDGSDPLSAEINDYLRSLNDRAPLSSDPIVAEFQKSLGNDGLAPRLN